MRRRNVAAAARTQARARARAPVPDTAPHVHAHELSPGDRAHRAIETAGRPRVQRLPARLTHVLPVAVGEAEIALAMARSLAPKGSRLALEWPGHPRSPPHPAVPSPPHTPP